MVEDKRVIVVGVPGVGKTTVMSGFIERLKGKGVEAKVVVYGTVMLEGARKLGIEERDELRKMNLDEMRKIQLEAASKIGRMGSDMLIIDTHLVVRTREGYLPGLPSQVVKELRPTNVVLITAPPEEVRERRASDKSRRRDMITLEEIKEEIDISLNYLSAVSNEFGVPVMIVKNEEGKVEEAVDELMRALG